jgi:hypothetical protein
MVTMMTTYTAATPTVPATVRNGQQGHQGTAPGRPATATWEASHLLRRRPAWRHTLGLDKQHERWRLIGERVDRRANSEVLLRVVDADTPFCRHDANFVWLNDRPATRGNAGPGRRLRLYDRSRPDRRAGARRGRTAGILEDGACTVASAGDLIGPDAGD